MTDEALRKQAAFLRIFANEQRLNILTTLSAQEMSVGRLALEVQLSPSALSQHLSKIRAEGLVATRRESQTIYYSIKSESVAIVLSMLEGIYGRQKPDFRLVG